MRVRGSNRVSKRGASTDRQKRFQFCCRWKLRRIPLQAIDHVTLQCHAHQLLRSSSAIACWGAKERCATATTCRRYSDGGYGAVGAVVHVADDLPW